GHIRAIDVSMSNLICDIDGVIYRGERAVSGSPAALARFEEAGWRILFCTNNSSRTRKTVAARIKAIAGYRAVPEQVVSSAAAGAQLVAETRPPTLVLGGDGIVEALEEVAVPVVATAAEARALMVGLDLKLSYARLREATLVVASGGRFVATNHDATYPVEDAFWPGAGALVAAVEVASGIKAELAGKPHQPIRDLLRSRLAPGPVWVVGDRPDTDLAMAAAEPEWSSALVLTGAVQSSEGVDPPPDLAAPDLAAVADELLGSHPRTGQPVR
ncbi:MAG: HAD-IIA family hydrolase, partial [Actinomycetota bacterium]